MKIAVTPRRLLAGVAVLAVAAALFIASGAISIKASSGHWAITAWILDFAKRRSVALHSIGIEAPALDDQAMVIRGAGHYESGCRSCHGAPAAPMPPIPERMTPHPPDLRLQLSRWNNAELFYIVRHGIKFTGMPAWPAPQRHDEVWSVVAFLRVLPTLDRVAYNQLVFSALDTHAESDAIRPPPNTVAHLARERCARCHGPNGEGRLDAAIPALAAQRPQYLRGALHAYARGTRHSGTMTPIAADLDPGAITALAAYYAAVGRRPTSTAEPSGISRGEDIALRGIPAQEVPPCAECHGPSPRDRNPAYPVIAGQPKDYLLLQLRLLATGARGGSEYVHLMERVAPKLTLEQMSDVAAFYAAQGPSSPALLDSQ